ncbi:MAG: S8 family serine peptidase [Nitrosospira sp.]|nr:S8 family serine peptidase [Nitrosospira sp.]
MNTNNQPFPAGSSGDSAKEITRSTTRGVSRIFSLPRCIAAAILTCSVGLAPSISNAEPRAGKGSGGNGPEAFAKGRILVMPRAGLPEKELGKILNAYGGKGRKMGQSDLYIVDLPPNASEKAIAAQLARHPELKSVELDQMVPPNMIPNDPYYGSAWHLPKIGASSAWDISEGAGVTIAILDSGVDSAHLDLTGRMVTGWNFYDNNSNTSDVYGHGTSVAGAAAAASNNSMGVASVAGQAKIMPLRITDLNGQGYYSMIAQAIIYAADHGARVANASFRGLPSSLTVQNAAQYMKNKGGLVIVSAGNTGIQENYPQTTTMIPVSATGSNDVKTSWSSYGSYIAMAAPGAGIWTTARGGGYGSVSGTSFSSPVTAGVVALMMAAKPALPNTQIESLLYSTAVDLGVAGRDAYYGHGRVDAGRALQAAVAATSTADTQAPSVSVSTPIAGATVSGLVSVNVSATDNVGVTRVELKVNNTTVAIDSSAPFAFAWDSAGMPNGMANLVAYAFDAAGNSKASAAVGVNVANGTVTVPSDTTSPVVKIINPVAGSVSGNNVPISLNATDDSGAPGITQRLYIDGVLKATGTGSTLGYNWNIRKIAAGTHVIHATVTDAAGNASSTSVNVTLIK